MHAPRVPLRSPPVGGRPYLRLVSSPQLRNASPDFQPQEAFRQQGETTMAARAQVKPDFDGPEDRQLADDTARVMHHRPLISRLARVEAMHGNPASTVTNTASNLAFAGAPALAEATPAHLDADPRSIEEVIDDLGYSASPPPSALWLDKARREKRQERTRHAMAWVTTFVIAATIVGGAFVLLRL